MESRDRVGINGVAVDGITSVTRANREAGVACGYFFDHKKISAPVAEFGSSGDMHEVAGDKA